MSAIRQIDYQSLLEEIKQDNTKKRFNTKVFLTNNFSVYFELIKELESLADAVVHLSDELICAGTDTIPDVMRVLPILEQSTDKNVLITSVGEYLHLGLQIESNRHCLFSIISHQAHSCKRVWIPIFGAKEEFIETVGELDDEHYPDIVYEVDTKPSSFDVTVYSKAFEQASDIDAIVGMREWFSAWDEKSIRPGMSLITRHCSHIKETEGVYTISTVLEPFQYFQRMVDTTSVEILPDYGSNDQWLKLALAAQGTKGDIKSTIEKALNLVHFNPFQILNRWNTASDDTRWLFWLWYELKLNSASDYISLSMQNAHSWKDVPKCLELSILQYLDNPHFDEWVMQRNEARYSLGVKGLSKEFWSAFNKIEDAKKKIKLLSNQTIEEKAKIIELIASEIKSGKTVEEYKALLGDKYPDLLFYLSRQQFLTEDIGKYIQEYKYLKIQDEFSREISDSAKNINIYEFDTRSQILAKIKHSRDAYYIWIDGMGVEWIDLLIKKVSERTTELSQPSITVGTAVLPTITSVNMAFADPDTVSYKVNDLDTLSHIKDKKDCNYFAVIAKQLAFIDEIAGLIVAKSKEFPHKDIVVTADHGMSRLAAKGFHFIEGVKAPSSGKVCCLGRYCEFESGSEMPDISNTIKHENIVAYKTHDHFSTSGFAPGEIHGGATPEEILVPVIRYQRRTDLLGADINNSSYTMDPVVTLKGDGIGELHIQTDGIVNKVTVEFKAKLIPAIQAETNKWVVNLENLQVNNDYSVRVYINNRFSEKEEQFYVRAPGLSFDDDLDF